MRTSQNIWAVGIILVLTAVHAARGADACAAGAKAASKSCVAGAKSDYALALGKCANLADPVAQKACQAQAKADLADALGECRDQLDARQMICDRLGPAPYQPVIVPTDFVAAIDNPLYPLTPGTTFIYVGTLEGAVESNVVAVTHNTKVIFGVTCAEVRDTVYADGVLTEDTLDWFAQDKDTNVWYFGENTHELEGNEIINIDGSFKAGVNGAQPGIIMKGRPAIGDFYRQEFDLANAEDLAEVISLTDTVTVPYGTFSNQCLKTLETTPLEPDARENKFYAPGVGPILTIDLVGDETLPLVQILTGQ